MPIIMKSNTSNVHTNEKAQRKLCPESVNSYCYDLFRIINSLYRPAQLLYQKLIQPRTTISYGNNHCYCSHAIKNFIHRLFSPYFSCNHIPVCLQTSHSHYALSNNSSILTAQASGDSFVVWIYTSGDSGGS